MTDTREPDLPATDSLVTDRFGRPSALSRRAFLGGAAVVAAGTLAGCSSITEVVQQVVPAEGAAEVPASVLEEVEPEAATKENEATEVAASDGRDLGTSSFEVSSVNVKARATTECDVCIVGAGLAGLTCALTLAELDPTARIVVLEKADAPGGSTALSSSPFGEGPRAADEQEAASAATEVVVASRGVVNPLLLKGLYGNARTDFTWLFDVHGVPYALPATGDGETAEGIAAATGEDPAWLAATGYGPDGGAGAIARLYEDALDAPNVEVIVSRPVTQLLLHDEYSVTGLRTRIEGDYYDFTADAVVLATGGMSTNKTLLANYVSKSMEKLVGWGAGQDGDGHLMAEQTAHGRCHHVCTSATQPAVAGFDEGAVLAAAAAQPQAVWVNETGRRFKNEVVKNAAAAMAAVETQGSVWSVFDAAQLAAWQSDGLVYGFDAATDAMVGAPLAGLEELAQAAAADDEIREVVAADTLEELAEAIGVSFDNLSLEIEALEAGKDAMWGKPEEWVRVPAEAPLYAVRLSAGMTHTQGGIRVNGNAQVVDTRGKAVHGLYACGAAIGGFTGEVDCSVAAQHIALWSARVAAQHIFVNNVDV